MPLRRSTLFAELDLGNAEEQAEFLKWFAKNYRKL
jgi:hypothetical protein